MATAREQISRRALLSFASNYNSASEAIMELVDNPIDYRGDRQLRIDVDVDFAIENAGMPHGRISIRDYGGQGMDIDDLQNWLRWGDGEGHEESDIGQFHVGGKLAAIYLAEKMQVTCRRAGDHRIWHFQDDHWGSRTEFIEQEFVELSPRTSGWISELDDDTGFVQVTLSGIKHGHFTLDELRATLTDTYETIVESGDLIVTVNGELLAAYTLPWLSGVTMHRVEKREILPGLFLEARVGAINRRDLPRGMSERVMPGIRTDFNGRKITAGETFGVNLHGRGRSQRVFGDISISGSNFRPNQNKTGWDLHSAEWFAISRLVKPMIQQVLRELEGPSQPGTRSAKQSPVPRNRNALSFNMSWLNDDGPEAEEAKRIERIAATMHMQPKEWVRYVVRNALSRQDENAETFGSPVWSDGDEDVVQ